MSKTDEVPAKIGFGNIFAGGQVKLKSVGPPVTAQNKAKKPTPSPAMTRNKVRKVIIKAEAEFDYEGEQEDEISFGEGEIFLVHNKEIYDGWAEGEVNGKRGVFPNNFVRFFEEEEEEIAAKPKPVPSPKPARNPMGSPPTSAPPTSAPPSFKPPTNGPPSSVGLRTGSAGGAGAVSRTKQIQPSSERSGRPTSAPVPPGGGSGIAAKAAFLNDELFKSGGPGAMGMSLPRKMNPSQMRNFGNFSDDMNTNKPKTQGFTANELRQFAIEHKDEFKKNNKSGADDKRTPAKFDTVASLEEVKIKMSSNPRNRTRAPSVGTADRPIFKNLTISGPVTAPGPSPSTTAPKRLSLVPSMEPPKPPTSPGPERRQFPPSVPLNKPTTPALLRQPPVSPCPSGTSEDNSDMYMEMDMEMDDVPEREAPVRSSDDLEKLRGRVAAMEAKSDANSKEIVTLQNDRENDDKSSGGSASMEEIAELKRRLAAAESANSKTNKLLVMLQKDLDEEINSRKQLETDMSRLKRIVEVLQE